MKVNRVLRSAWRRLVIVVLVTAAAGCSDFHRVDSVAALKPSHKAIIGEINFVEGDVASWTPGHLLSVCLTMAYPMPAKGLDFELNKRGGDCLQQQSFKEEESGGPNPSRFGPHGGIFTAEVKNEDLYVLAIQTSATVLVTTFYGTFPLWIRVRPSANRCEYIGTIVVHKDGHEMVVTVEDQFDRKKSSYASWVQGCDLQRSLGYRASDAEIAAMNRKARAVGDANAAPPRNY